MEVTGIVCAHRVHQVGPLDAAAAPARAVLWRPGGPRADRAEDELRRPAARPRGLAPLHDRHQRQHGRPERRHDRRAQVHLPALRGRLRARRGHQGPELPGAPRDAGPSRAATVKRSGGFAGPSSWRRGNRNVPNADRPDPHQSDVDPARPALLGPMLTLITGHPDWIVLVGVYLLMGVRSTPWSTPRLLKYQPPWMTFVLALVEFGLLLCSPTAQGSNDRRVEAIDLLLASGCWRRSQDRRAADHLADLHRVGGRVPPGRVVAPARAPCPCP